MQQYNIDNGDRAMEEIWETRSFGIEGMTCDNCVKTVTKTLKKINGVKDVSVDREAAAATVTYDTTKTDMPALHEALLQSGYKPARLVAT
ncbi:MAG: heavy-metal-associated domain-containing protein [Verrucomicrobiales bacterium]